MSKKTVVEFTSRRITYETPLPIADVIARLDKEINKADGSPRIIRVLRESQTRAELEKGVNALTNGRDFVYFTDNAYHRWLDTYAGATGTPETYVYTLGNPLIAQGMLQYDLVAALHVPPKILVSAKGSGTRVVYDDPATTIPVPSFTSTTVDAEMRTVAEGLSGKLEVLVKSITRPELDV